MRKLSGKNKGKVRVSTSGGVKAKATTPAKGKKLVKLLNAIDHGWKPTKKKQENLKKGNNYVNHAL